MKLIFKRKVLVESGFIGDIKIEKDNIAKIKFKETLPLIKGGDFLNQIGEVTKVHYSKAMNKILGSLEFHKRPEFTTYEPLIVENKLKAVMNLKNGKYVLRWPRFKKNIRKFARSTYR